MMARRRPPEPQPKPPPPTTPFSSPFHRYPYGFPAPPGRESPGPVQYTPANSGVRARQPRVTFPRDGRNKYLAHSFPHDYVRPGGMAASHVVRERRASPSPTFDPRRTIKGCASSGSQRTLSLSSTMETPGPVYSGDYTRLSHHRRARPGSAFTREDRLNRTMAPSVDGPGPGVQAPSLRLTSRRPRSAIIATSSARSSLRTPSQADEPVWPGPGSYYAEPIGPRVCSPVLGSASRQYACTVQDVTNPGARARASPGPAAYQPHYEARLRTSPAWTWSARPAAETREAWGAPGDPFGTSVDSDSSQASRPRTAQVRTASHSHSMAGSKSTD